MGGRAMTLQQAENLEKLIQKRNSATADQTDRNVDFKPTNFDLKRPFEEDEEEDEDEDDEQQAAAKAKAAQQPVDPLSKSQLKKQRKLEQLRAQKIVPADFQDLDADPGLLAEAPHQSGQSARAQAEAACQRAQAYRGQNRPNCRARGKIGRA